MERDKQEIELSFFCFQTIHSISGLDTRTQFLVAIENAPFKPFLSVVVRQNKNINLSPVGQSFRGTESIDRSAMFVWPFCRNRSPSLHRAHLQVADHSRRIYTFGAAFGVRVMKVVVNASVAWGVGEQDAQTHGAAPRQFSGTLQPSGNIGHVTRP